MRVSSRKGAYSCERGTQSAPKKSPTPLAARLVPGLTPRRFGPFVQSAGSPVPADGHPVRQDHPGPVRSMQEKSLQNEALTRQLNTIEIVRV